MTDMGSMASLYGTWACCCQASECYICVGLDHADCPGMQNRLRRGRRETKVASEDRYVANSAPALSQGFY